jgi:hypothetical protein
MTLRSESIDPRAFSDAIAFITREIVGNEIGVTLPASLRPYIAVQMVEDKTMGWPDVETAHATLDDREWQWPGWGREDA